MIGNVRPYPDLMNTKKGLCVEKSVKVSLHTAEYYASMI